MREVCSEPVLPTDTRQLLPWCSHMRAAKMRMCAGRFECLLHASRKMKDSQTHAHLKSLEQHKGKVPPIDIYILFSHDMTYIVI